MGGFDGARGAGGTRGTGQTLQVERNDESLTFDAGEGEVGRVRSAGSRRSVRARIGNARKEPLFEPIAESGDAGRVSLKR